MVLRIGPIIAVASLGILAAVLVMQYGFGYRPCELCHWQRYPFIATAALGGIAWWLGGRMPRVSGALIGLAGATFLVGAGIAAFHVGVEQKWWAGLETCGSTTGPATSIEDLRRQLLGAPIVRCDEVAWSLFGVSLAGYNVLVSLALAALAVFAARRMMLRPA
jgi:disulfide bond formation protein DsbB